MKYLHLFDTTSKHNTAYNDWGGVHIEPWIAVDKQTGNISYNDPDYMEIPSPRRFIKKGSLVVNSSGAVTNGTIFTINTNESNTIYYFMISGDETVYKLTPVWIMHELDHYEVTGLSAGTYNGVYLL